MKTMCPPGYHHNGFVAIHALGHMKHSVCRGSLMTTYMTTYIPYKYIYIYIYIPYMYIYVYLICIYIYIYIYIYIG